MAAYLEMKSSLGTREKYAALSRAGQQRDADMDSGNLLMREKLTQLKEQFFHHLTPHEKVQMARHPQRHTRRDYVRLIFKNF